MSWIQGFFTSVPYFVILIGLLVFVHEVGHFIFAKLFKVKVHVFSLGFGPKLIGFKRGETLYKVSLVPVGGYVKMLGEDPTEEILPEDRGRAFGDKPLMQRFLIVIGGPVMNLVFPVFLHFGVGLSYTEVFPPEAGIVMPGMPAYEAGVRPGDIIESIDGETMLSFSDLVEQVSPRPGQKIKIIIRRGDERFERMIEPEPTQVTVILDEKETVGRIGVGPGYLPPLIGVADSTNAAFRAGLKPFDLVVSVGSVPVSRLVDLEKMLVQAAGSSVSLTVKKMREDAKPPFQPFKDQFSNKAHTISLPVPLGTKSLEDLGIEASADYVAHVTQGGIAEKIGLRRGDRLVSLDGKKYTLGRIFAAIDEKPGKTRTLVFARRGQEFSKPFLPSFIPAGEAGKLGIKRDTYDKGFWGFVGKRVMPKKIRNKALFSTAVSYATSETWSGIRLIGLGFKMLFEGRISMRSMGGPIMIGQLAGQAGQQGASTFIWMMALISLNLGLINLLPIPVLDGGHIVFIAIESVTRRPINRAVKERIMIVGLAMILLLMVFATWNDIARLVVG